jgi:LmbE family N-acetylglucosaminyl deacetylase
LSAVQREWPADQFSLPAVVFAPHPDDETLGCGGTIVHKIRAGAEVKIVVMTDGALSHPRLMAEEEMRARRSEEALAAAQTLGVAKENVYLLGFPDGQLLRHHEPAVARVSEVLRREQPDQVFLPYDQDGPPDHQATTAIVLQAVAAFRPNATVYEYPIWFWYHWPWTGPLYGVRASAAANRSLWRDFRCFVRIGEVLEIKRAALQQHRSQMQRLVPDPSWLTLGDVSNGEFLRCFFQKREVFRRHGVTQRTTRP